MSLKMALRVISRARNNRVAFGAKRTSEGAQYRRHRSQMTRIGHHDIRLVCLIFGVLRDTYDEETFTFYRFASIQCRCLVTMQLDRYPTEASLHKQLAQLSVGVEAESMLRVARHLFRSPCDEEKIATGP